MSDRLEFSIEGVRQSIEGMRDANSENKKRQQEFLSYVEQTLVPNWDTPQGKIATDELKQFVNGEFQDYIRYLDEKINALDENVVPALENINRG